MRGRNSFPARREWRVDAGRGRVRARVPVRNWPPQAFPVLVRLILSSDNTGPAFGEEGAATFPGEVLISPVKRRRGVILSLPGLCPAVQCSRQAHCRSHAEGRRQAESYSVEYILFVQRFVGGNRLIDQVVRQRSGGLRKMERFFHVQRR